LSNGELNVLDHDRDSAGLNYVYPVVSRRAGGVSVGINLNTNNACNWRCIYCQVPDLKLGMAPPVDLAVLEQELRGFLHELLHGSFMQQRVPEGARRINDIALSGNGEPTSAAEFVQVIELIKLIILELGLQDTVKLVLITNGSLMYRENVQQGLRLMSQIQGEVWFKVDRASVDGMKAINDTRTSLDKVRHALGTAIQLCPTWLQTCWFALDGKAPSVQDEEDFLRLLETLLKENRKPRGVLLYTLARQSHQPEATRLSPLSMQELEPFAARIRALQIEVKISV
jgi:hypothetical protein